MIDGLTLDELKQADFDWEPHFMDLAAKFALAGLNSTKLPSSWAWTWEKKMVQWGDSMAFLGISYCNTMQGLLAVDLNPRLSYLTLVSDDERRFKSIHVYSITAAPWNLTYYLKQIGRTPVFRHVGTILMTAAVLKGMELGCEGRLILHSLEGTEDFYRNMV